MNISKTKPTANAITATKSRPRPKMAVKPGLIIGASDLKSHIIATLQQYTSNGQAIHQAVVSALYHAAVHGDPSLLNVCYGGLRTNDQQAVKLWIRRAFIVNGLDGGSPEGLAQELIVKACQAGEILSLVKGKFAIVAGPNHPQSKTLAALCAKRFIKPDGTIDRGVLQRNNFAEVKTLGDVEVLEKVRSLKKYLKDTDKQKVNLTPATVDFINHIALKADQMLAA